MVEEQVVSINKYSCKLFLNSLYLPLTMKHYLQILLLLVPAILFSAEWEKVDLPNLNNEIIRSVSKVDSIFVVEKQNRSIIISTDLKDWVALDSSKFKPKILERLYFKFIPEAKEYIKKIDYETSWCEYSESGLIYYNQDSNYLVHEIYRNNKFKENLRFNVINSIAKSIQSRDKYLYFILNDTLFTIDSVVVSKVKIDRKILEESFIIAFHHEDNLYVKSINNELISNKEKFYTVESDTLMRLEEKEITEKFKLKFLKVDDVKKKEKQLGVVLNIPTTTYIHYFWVKNNILNTKPADYSEMTYIDFNYMQILDFSKLEEDYFLKSNSERFGNYYFRIINNWKDSATIEIYDSTFIVIKRINFNYYDLQNNSCYIEGYFDNYVIIQSGGERLKLDLQTLEYESLFSAPYTVCNFSNKMIIMNGPYYEPESETYLMDTTELSNHRAIFSYSLDYGKSWVKDTLNGNVSDKHFNTCARGENSHSLDVVGKTIYSFTKDTIYVAKIGQKQFESLLYVEYEYHLRYKGKIYFLDYNTDIIYILSEEGKYTALKCPVNKVVNFCIDNGYLNAANSEELYRLKLE